MRCIEGQRSQHLTQKDTRQYGRSYIANTSSACGRSGFLNEESQHDHIDYFQSLAKVREAGLVTKLPMEKEAEATRHPDLVRLKEEMTRLKHENASPSDIEIARPNARSLRASLMKKSLKRYLLVSPVTKLWCVQKSGRQFCTPL